MSRSVAWRRTISDVTSWHQDEASNARIYILREMGPTGFLLKEDGEPKYFKVYLGDPHTCTCTVFKKEKDLCKHICWVILKKFRVPRQNAVSWQLGLIEQEITDLVRGIAAAQPVKPSVTAKNIAAAIEHNQDGSLSGDNGSHTNTVLQREIGNSDVCPICQDELLSKHEPVTYCRFSCGNNIHIKCMKVWAEHQKSTGKAFIECPFCREDFGPLNLLQVEYKNAAGADLRAELLHEHPGVLCFACHALPIYGKCYRCMTCSNMYLCHTCFSTDAHQQHNFQYRQKTAQKWRPAPSRSSEVLPAAVISSLLTRDISEQDYDLLLQLDNPPVQLPSSLTKATVESFPLKRVCLNSIFLAPGQQCRVCLRGYAEGQQVRHLPCRHCFHKDCIDDWLLNHHPTCPVDGAVYTNESVQQIRKAERLRKLRLLKKNKPEEHRLKNRTSTRLELENMISLEVPGVGLQQRASRHTNADPKDHKHNIPIDFQKCRARNSAIQESSESGNRNHHHMPNFSAAEGTSKSFLNRLSSMKINGLPGDNSGASALSDSAKIRQNSRLRLQSTVDDFELKRNQRKIKRKPDAWNPELGKDYNLSALYIGNNPSEPVNLTGEVFGINLHHNFPLVPIQQKSFNHKRCSSLSRLMDDAIRVTGKTYPYLVVEK